MKYLVIAVVMLTCLAATGTPCRAQDSGSNVTIGPMSNYATGLTALYWLDYTDGQGVKHSVLTYSAKATANRRTAGQSGTSYAALQNNTGGVISSPPTPGTIALEAAGYVADSGGASSSVNLKDYPSGANDVKASGSCTTASPSYDYKKTKSLAAPTMDPGDKIEWKGGFSCSASWAP